MVRWLLTFDFLPLSCTIFSRKKHIYSDFISFSKFAKNNIQRCKIIDNHGT